MDIISSIIYDMNKSRSWIFTIGALLILGIGTIFAVRSVSRIASQLLDPVTNSTGLIATSMADFTHPTPTILPDPLVIIHDVKNLAQLNTVQYSIERVVTAEIGQGTFGSLFGDKVLFVAHGIVLAGIDLQKLGPKDMWLEDGALYVKLPAAEIFIATLDNDKSYVYDRETGLLTKGDINLETSARRVAEDSIEEAALEDGILEQARINGEAYLFLLFQDLGYPVVEFVQ